MLTQSLDKLIEQAIANMPLFATSNSVYDLFGVDMNNQFNIPEMHFGNQIPTVQELAKANRVRIMHVISNGGKGGVTIAYQKSSPDHPFGKMLKVAVAYCSSHDQYTKKIGTELALTRFFEGETVEVPANRASVLETEARLKSMFAYCVDIFE